VLRGGYGLFYFIDRGGISNQLHRILRSPGYRRVTYAQGFRITLSGSLPCAPTCTPATAYLHERYRPIAIGSFALGTGQGQFNLAAPTGVSVVALLPSNITPMVSEWNLQIQHQLGNNQSVRSPTLAHTGRIWCGIMIPTRFCSIPVRSSIRSWVALVPRIQGASRITTPCNCSTSIACRMASRWTGAFTRSKTLDDALATLMRATAMFRSCIRTTGLSAVCPTRTWTTSCLPARCTNYPLAGAKRWGGDVSKWMDYVVGGWQINAIYTLQGGTPFSITASGTPNTARADLVGKVHINPGNLQNYVDASAFAAPAKNAAGIYIAPGTAGRDIVRGPGFSNLDFALFKNFPVTERIKGQFRVQAYNLTNTPHFSNPADTNLNDGKIGQINSVLTTAGARSNSLCVSLF